MMLKSNIRERQLGNDGVANREHDDAGSRVLEQQLVELWRRIACVRPACSHATSLEVRLYTSADIHAE